MDASAILSQLEELGNDSRRRQNAKRGAGDNQFGVLLGPLRAFAKKLGINHTLALSLWDTGNTDAMILSTMMLDAKELSEEKAREMVSSINYSALLDEFIFNTLYRTPFAAKLADEWTLSELEYTGRAGWALVISEIMDGTPSEERLNAILDIIKRDMKQAPLRKQESMNRALCEIGIKYPAFTERCIALGEEMGVFRDQKVPKGCTSAFAPIWIPVGIKLRAARKNSR